MRTYADSGKSGLRIDGREALQRLIRDVESGQADFSVILVYDVSPWGRLLAALRTVVDAVSSDGQVSEAEAVAGRQ